MAFAIVYSQLSLWACCSPKQDQAFEISLPFFLVYHNVCVVTQNAKFCKRETKLPCSTTKSWGYR